MTTTPTTTTTVPLDELAESWAITLTAEGKTRHHQGVPARRRILPDLARGQGTAAPVLDRASVSAWLADLRDAGQGDGTIRLRYSARETVLPLAGGGGRDQH